MTRVVVTGRGNLLEAISVEGHAGYSVAGKDIVCSSVTTLIQALHIGLSDVLKVPVSCNTDREGARISISWEDSSDDPQVQAIARTICEAYRALASTYPEYVKLVEVQRDAL